MGRKKKARSYPSHHIPDRNLEDLVLALADSTATSFPLSDDYENKETPVVPGIVHFAFVQEGTLVLVTSFPNPGASRAHINKANFESSGCVCRSREGVVIKTAALCPDRKYASQVQAQVSAHNDTIDRLLRLVLP